MTNTQWQFRKDTAANLGAATPAVAELGFATDTKKLVVGDGSTLGGIPLAKESQPDLVLKQSSTPSPTAEGKIEWDTDDNRLAIGDGTGTRVFSDDSVRALLSMLAPQGRLTLSTGIPVLTSDVTAAATVYYTPYVGQVCPIYNGTVFLPAVFAELSIALDATNALSGKNYDVFVVNDAGTIRAVYGPAWSTDTARGTGAGTTELQRLNGLPTNKVSMTGRYSSGGTVSVAANQGTYVGTFRASANGQTQVKFGTAGTTTQEAWVGLWNCYNRAHVACSVTDTTSSWAYTSATIRQANGQAANKISFVRGLDEDGVSASYTELTANAAAIGANLAIYVGLDSVTAAAGVKGYQYSTAASGTFATAGAAWSGLPGPGFHYIAALESSDGSHASSFNGAAGNMAIMASMRF